MIPLLSTQHNTCNWIITPAHVIFGQLQFMWFSSNPQHKMFGNTLLSIEMGCGSGKKKDYVVPHLFCCDLVSLEGEECKVL